MLRAGPFEDQREMFHFAHALESAPEVAEIALVRADLEEAWFSLRSPSSHALAECLDRLEEFDVLALPSEKSVTARLARPAPPPPPDPEDPVLPPRRRYRLFRHADASFAAAVADSPGSARTPTAKLAEDVAEFSATASRGLPGSAPSGDVGSRPASTPAPIGRRSQRQTLVCTPFGSIDAANEFHEQVRNLRGVRGAWRRCFDGGVLHLIVDYEKPWLGGRSLARRLRDIKGFEWRLVLEATQEIHIELSERAK